MARSKKLLLIPLVLVAALLINCWFIILTTEILATWRQYIGLLLFICLLLLFIKDDRKATVATGIYLLLATFNALAVTPGITTSWLQIGELQTPPVQLLSLGLFILYFVLNLDTLIDIYLEYQEQKKITASKKE